ncbi:MAG: conserved domain protein glutamate-rich [Firmicutes bacterium]|nr:conserved domain protein glutamate-rich [Bacillota bacterium]
MSDSRLQEIVTKAVVGRAERRMYWSHTVPAEGVTGVLGVHVTDSSIAVKEKDGRASVDVIVDLDLWCGNPKHTKMNFP